MSLSTALRTPMATDNTRRIGSRGVVRRKKGFKPFVAPKHPPQGTYDPTLDASVRAAGRGLADYTQDYTRDYDRRTHDYLLSRGNLQTTQKRSLADLLRGYTNLGSNQTMAANAGGLLGTGDVVGGGFAAQAAAKRAANRGREQTRMNTDFSKQFASMGLGYQRSNEDAATLLARAQRENKFFGLDTSAAEFYQAAGTGYTPPSRPSWEKVMGHQHYKPLGNGQYMLPSGRVVTLAQLKRRSKKKKPFEGFPVPTAPPGVNQGSIGGSSG